MIGVGCFPGRWRRRARRAEKEEVRSKETMVGKMKEKEKWRRGWKIDCVASYYKEVCFMFHV